MARPASPASGAQRRAPLIRLAGVAGSAVAALAVWVIARFAGGLRLHTPAFAPSAHPASLAAGFAVVVAALAGLAGWAVLALIERTTRHPRRSWTITGAVLALLSLSAPLSGHGISGAGRLALAGLHLAVAAVLIPTLAATARPRKRGRQPAQ